MKMFIQTVTEENQKIYCPSWECLLRK